MQWVETVVSGVGAQEQRNRNTGNCGHWKSKQGHIRTDVGGMAGNSVGLMDLQRRKKHLGIAVTLQSTGRQTRGNTEVVGRELANKNIGHDFFSLGFSCSHRFMW